MFFVFSRIFPFLLIFFSNFVWADLMIAPTRVVFIERERGQTVNLINISNKTNTYRLHWKEQKQGLDGQYQSFAKGELNPDSASSMIRFSPRQVTLKPGERQTIRLMLRRKKDLKKQDYRSHLVFQKLPNQDEVAEEKNQGAKLELKANIGFSIPVIVRSGDYDTSIDITRVEMLEAEEQGEKIYGIGVDLSRSGSNSVYGSLAVYWKKSQEAAFQQIGILNNVAVYPELNTRKVLIGLKKLPAKSGFIKVKFEGSEDLKGRLKEFHEQKVNDNHYKLHNFR